MMVMALTLLLIALGFVLYRDRDFWFPEAQDADTQPSQPTLAAKTPAQPSAVAKSSPKSKSKPRHVASAKPEPPDSSPADSSDAPIVNRTVLPPLEVEVVAGNVHRNVRPGTNSVRVDLQRETPAQATSEPAVVDSQPAASVATPASERVEMSADTTGVVSHPVKPDYPLLARQMKVQGSVILQALIGRDGLIQDLRVVSGPPILANAAQEAVKQWHFKPHYQGVDTVETQARITVNFTISTN